MKLDCQIQGSDGLVLVPYCRHHVEKYHGWMASPLLQELTASEPLSLEEEYAMQVSWTNDSDKCTFIVLAFDSSMSSAADGECELPTRHSEGTIAREIDAMVGDVNLFFNNHDDPTEAEAEIMIAEEAARRKGFGRQALLLMLDYAATKLNVTKYMAKIGFKNEASLNMFSSLGFIEVSRCDIFKEVTLELAWSDRPVSVKRLVDGYGASILPYERPEAVGEQMPSQEKSATL